MICSIIQCQVLRDQGIALAGPDPHTLIDPVHPDEIRQAQLATLHERWSAQLQDPFRLHSREYRAYAVLTMARALYTLRHGTVISKPAAARWAQEVLDEHWARLIEQALAWRHDLRPDNLDYLDETLDFIRHILERSAQYHRTIDRG